MHPGRFPPAVFLPAALLSCFLVSGAAVSALAQEPEILKAPSSRSSRACSF